MSLRTLFRWVGLPVAGFLYLVTLFALVYVIGDAATEPRAQSAPSAASIPTAPEGKRQ